MTVKELLDALKDVDPEAIVLGISYEEQLSFFAFEYAAIKDVIAAPRLVTYYDEESESKADLRIVRHGENGMEEHEDVGHEYVYDLPPIVPALNQPKHELRKAVILS
jgi:hypothetical protein